VENYVQIHMINRRYGEIHALRDVSFHIRQGELLTLCGPSGAGRVRCCGFWRVWRRPTAGTVTMPYDARSIHPPILVFQEQMLFPHLTVAGNVAFGLRARRRRLGLTRTEISRRVQECLAQLQIADTASRWPGQLSGGQRRRVALARALVLEPSLLLLDEPFAGLDRPLLGETARYLQRVQRRTGVTMIVVSHDLEALMTIADRLGVLENGQLHQLDRPAHVAAAPATPAVVRLLAGLNGGGVS
jgi:putative spermidine/putrescine transport system ATP-binding protein